MTVCGKCNATLIEGVTWYSCHVRMSYRICKTCHCAATKAHKVKNRDAYNAYQREAMRRRNNIDPANYRYTGDDKR